MLTNSRRIVSVFHDLIQNSVNHDIMLTAASIWPAIILYILLMELEFMSCFVLFCFNSTQL